MERMKNYYRLSVVVSAMIMMSAIFSLGRTRIMGAAETQIPTVGASVTPLPASSLNPTLTLPPVPSLTPTIQHGVTPTHSRTPLSSASPTDTATTVPLVQAQPTQISTGPLIAQEVALATYGVGNLAIGSPEGSAQFAFQLPNNWQPDGNNFLNLNVEYFAPNVNNGTASTTANTILQVRFDNELAVSVALTADNVGTRNITVPLRLGLLDILARRNHTILITFDGRNLCQNNQEGHITIRNDLSYFHFEYHEGSPLRDLASYPLPFFNNPIGNQVDTTLIVLPAKYTTNDLQAASALAAGLGQLTNNKLVLRVATDNTLTDDDQKNFNLIAVGQIGTNALIDGLYSSKVLPSVLGTDGKLSVNNKPIVDTDGVVEIAANPKNPLRSILVITSKTTEGVMKAVGAMAGPPSVLKLGGTLALISDINPMVGVSPSIHQTFASLGYQDITLSGPGTRTAEIRFVAPLGMTLTNGASVTLQYDLADTLQTAQTTLTLTMNDTPLDSVAVGLNKTNVRSTTGSYQLRASIPPNSVKAGATNLLSIQLDVQGNWKCDPPNPAAVWFVIHSTSEIYLPNQKADPLTLNPSLGLLPSPFNTSPDLGDTLISLPTDPTLGDLEQMVRLSSYLGGETSTGARYTPHVSLGIPSKDIDLSHFHFIVLGRPTTNPFLKQLNDTNKLPQPFMPTSDELKQVLDSIVYRLPPNYNLGVLEAFRSPWAPERVILVVSGTSAVGQGLAASVLLDGKYGPSDLTGNIAFANTTSISVVDTSSQQIFSATVTPVADATSTSQMTPTVGSIVTNTATIEPTIPVYTVTPYPSLTPAPTENQW